MALTDTAIRNAKATDKAWKLADEKGLFVLIHPNGAKYWRQKYRYNGKEKTLAHGVYPDVGLKDARERRDAARKLLFDGIDSGGQPSTTIENQPQTVFFRLGSALLAALGVGGQGCIFACRRLFERELMPGRPSNPSLHAHAC